MSCRKLFAVISFKYKIFKIVRRHRIGEEDRKGEEVFPELQVSAGICTVLGAQEILSTGSLMGGTR